MESRAHRFTHRVHTDGTVDSICHVCFHTIGPVDFEDALEKLETEHVCKLEDVARFHLDTTNSIN